MCEQNSNHVLDSFKLKLNCDEYGKELGKIYRERALKNCLVKMISRR